MAQLSLFPDEAPKHYDRVIPQKSYSSKKSEPQLVEHESADKLEETVLETFAELYMDVKDSFKDLKDIKQYARSDISDKQNYLLKFPKFRGSLEHGNQNIKDYPDSQIFGLFNGLLKSFEKKYQRKQEEYNDFYEQNKTILKNIVVLS